MAASQRACIRAWNIRLKLFAEHFPLLGLTRLEECHLRSGKIMGRGDGTDASKMSRAFALWKLWEVHASCLLLHIFCVNHGWVGQFLNFETKEKVEVYRKMSKIVSSKKEQKWTSQNFLGTSYYFKEFSKTLPGTPEFLKFTWRKRVRLWRALFHVTWLKKWNRHGSVHKVPEN